MDNTARAGSWRRHRRALRKALRAVAPSRAGYRRGTDQPGEAADEFRGGADGRRAVIERHAGDARQLAVVAVELDQRLGVLGDEGARRDADAAALAAGHADLVLGGRHQPFERADATLISDAHVEHRSPPTRAPPRGGRLDLPLIGVAAIDDALRQAVRR